MKMVECSVKTQLNGKSFIYRYGILVDDFDTGRPLINRKRKARGTEKRVR
jgi:hypothetical protein